MLKKVSQLLLCNKQQQIRNNQSCFHSYKHCFLSLPQKPTETVSSSYSIPLRDRPCSSGLSGFRFKYLVQTECFGSTFYYYKYLRYFKCFSCFIPLKYLVCFTFIYNCLIIFVHDRVTQFEILRYSSLERLLQYFSLNSICKLGEF